jgi:hypothetical protein
MSALNEAMSRTRALFARAGAEQPQEGHQRNDQRAELRRRRDILAQEVTELHWDLGGLAYEMAIRDHFRLDVLVRRAALLQQRDAELAEVERLLRLEEHGAAGICPSCAALHSRGAAYCWQCGATLTGADAGAVERDGRAAASEHASTAVMEALFSPAAARSRPPGDTGE